MLRSNNWLLTILLCVALLGFGGYSHEVNKDGDSETHAIVRRRLGWDWSDLFIIPAILDGVCYVVRAFAGDVRCEGVEKKIKIEWSCRSPWTCSNTKNRCQKETTNAKGIIVIVYQLQDDRRRFLDNNLTDYDNEPSADYLVFSRGSIPMTALCWDDPLCSDMLINYNFLSGSEQARCTEFGCTGEELLLFQQSVDEIVPLVCSCDNDPSFGKTCDSDDDCSDCLQCCPVNKICEIPPASKLALIQHDINDNKENFVEPKFEEKKAFYESLVFEYISSVGFIAFILINTVFIAYWCFKRKGNQAKYEKCEIVTINDE